jgi:hypothetical protein
MLIDGRVKQVLKFDDINSLVAFRDWLKHNLTLYGEDEIINDNHLKIFLEHIKNKVKEQRVFEKREWFEQIDQLIERIEEK